jgi:hypothetical protein
MRVSRLTEIPVMYTHGYSVIIVDKPTKMILRFHPEQVHIYYIQDYKNNPIKENWPIWKSLYGVYLFHVDGAPRYIYTRKCPAYGAPVLECGSA